MKAKACSGLVELHVRDVIPIEEAHTNALVLVSNDGTVLPIFVDRPEAVAIAFQLAHRTPPHPLPEALLSKVIHGLGGKVVEVRIRNIRDDASKCRIVVRQGSRYIDFTSRPSDAVAAALSVGAHIYVPSSLLKKDGITKREIDQMRKHMGMGGSGPGPGTKMSNPPPDALDGGTPGHDIKL